jgi:hypothetical protein
MGGGRKGSDNTAAILAEQQRVQQERAQRDAETAAANASRAEQERIAREAEASQRFSSDLEQALGITRAGAQERIARLGLDPAQYNDRIERELQATRLRVPQGAQGVGQFFNTDFVDTLLNEDRSVRRQSATARAQRELPSDFTSTFSSSADDPFIDTILGRQSGEARAQLERAQRRGNLTDTGFTAGMGRISELERAGRSQAQALGDSIINRFRSEAGDVRNRALERAGSVDLFEPDFDLTPFNTQLADVQNRFNTNLAGEVEGALAGQSFFDIGDILNRAGVTQGAQNAAGTAELSPAAVLAERQRRQREEAQRGIGGGGTF